MSAARLLSFVMAGLAGVTVVAQGPAARPRARDLGLVPGVFAPGPLNAITNMESGTVSAM